MNNFALSAKKIAKGKDPGVSFQLFRKTKKGEVLSRPFILHLFPLKSQEITKRCTANQCLNAR